MDKTIPHFFRSYPNDVIKIEINLGKPFCRYNAIRGRQLYRHFFRGSISLSGVRTKHWWRNNIYGGVYWLLPSECIHINMIAVPNESLNIDYFIKSFRYRFAALTSYKAMLNPVKSTDLVFPNQYFSFGQLYLLESKTKNGRPTTSCP